jgi:hypothetical protein
MCAVVLKDHQHGKSRVRLGRTWREGDVHYFVEWTVHTMLESDMAHAFLEGSNADMTATDTQKNTVGCFCPTARDCSSGPLGMQCQDMNLYLYCRSTILPNNATPDAALKSTQSGLLVTLWTPTPRLNLPYVLDARLSCSHKMRVKGDLCQMLCCCQVSKAKVWVEAAPWERVIVDGQLHDHGKIPSAEPNLSGHEGLDDSISVAACAYMCP